jgi:hypothetical protein
MRNASVGLVVQTVQQGAFRLNSRSVMETDPYS